MNNDLFTDEPAPEKSAAQFTDEPAPESIGKMESFSRGAANNFPLLPQAIAAGESVTGIGDEGGYSKNLADWNAKAAAAKAANPKTYGAGAVTGSLAPLAIPGVGEALEAAPILGNAVYGGLNAVSNTDLLKNPGEALKEGLMGAGMSAATAGLVKGLTPEAETLEKAADRTAVKSLHMPAGHLVDMEPAEREALGQFARSNGLVGRNKEEVLDKARELMEGYGEKIGELGEKSEELGLHINPDEHYKAVRSLLDKSESFGGLANREARGLARNYQAGANDILNLPDNPSWSDIQKLKDQYGGLAFKSTGEVKDEAAKDTYFALKDMLKSIAEKAHGNPGMPEEYKQALAAYSQMHPIVGGLEKAVDAELRSGAGHGGHSIMSVLKSVPAPVRAGVGVAGALAGHPHYALAAALPELMNPAVQSKALGAAATMLPGIRQGATQEFTDYLESQYGKKERKQ